MKRLWWRLCVWVEGIWWPVRWGFWLTLGDLLWKFEIYRNAYYTYREKAWREANVALSFDMWLENGGWKLWTSN